MSTPSDDNAHDDTLAGYDLDAWQPPAPPPGLADAVVARMQQAPAPVRAAAPSARTVVTAAIATLVAAAAIAVVVVTHSGRDTPPGDLAAQTDSPTTSPMSPAQPSAPLPAGTPDVDAERMRVLEERVAELEARLADLEAAQNDPHRHVDPFKTRTPVPAPIPAQPAPPHHYVNPFDPLYDVEPGHDHDHDHNDVVDPFGKSCDAPTLVRQGKSALTMGAYGAASTLFEAALHCDPSDVWTLKLAYTAACHIGASQLATAHYQHLAPSDQNALLQMCIRYGIDPRSSAMPLPPTPTPPLSGNGTVSISSKPAAHVYIDGADSGATTPVSRELPAGKHKVTFEVGGDKYTYSIMVRDGETATLSKDLQ